MDIFNRWKEKASQYIDVRLGLFKLSLIERTSTVLGQLLTLIIYIFFGLAVLTFLGFGLMETFATLLHSRVGGSFATAGLFLILLLIVYAMRRKIVNGFAGIFIRVMTDGDDDEDDEDYNKESRKIKVGE